MKISELNTKSFLGASGAAENSYVLINYEDETTNEPVTYKATVQELGKTIANKLGLTVNGSSGINTIENSNGTWVPRTAGNIVTQAEKNKIAAAATQSQMAAAIETATSGLASTGDVTNAVNGLASTGYVTNAVSGLASIGYVTTAVENAGGGSEFDPGASITLEESSTNNEISTYPVFIGGAHNTFYDASNSGYATPIFTMGRDRVVVFSSGAGIGYYDPGSSDFNAVEIDADFNPKTYVDEDNYDQKLLFYKDSSGTPTIQVYDSDNYEYDTIALAPLQIGYDNDTYDAAYIDANGHLIKVDTNDPTTGDYTADFGVVASEGYVTSHIGPSMGDIAAEVHSSLTALHGYVADIANAKAAVAVSTAVSGLASTGAVTAAVNGLASTGYVTAAVANAGGGGFNPTTPVTCSVISENVTSQESLYPAMIIDDSGVNLWVQSQTSAGKFIYGGVIASVNDLNGMACVSTSDNQPCIRDRNQDFVGFLQNDLSGMAYISSSDNRPCIRNRNYGFIGFLSTT